MKNKVSEFEFRISYGEIDDGFLRTAELIKEGYTVKTIANEPRFSLETSGLYSKPLINITLQKRRFLNE